MKESINLIEEFLLIEGYRIEQFYTMLASNLFDVKEVAVVMSEKCKL